MPPLELTPVDHDPFAAPVLTPVDHDPFASAAPATGRPSGRLQFHEPTKLENGVRLTVGGNELPGHIQALKIPPAWTGVTYSPDPDAALLATGYDSTGRRQSIYAKKFSATRAAAKFARVNELDQKFNEIHQQNELARVSSNPKTAAAADVAKLIMNTGIRPGSETDTGAKVKAYGATTLLGKHVELNGDATNLKFIGKKGVPLNIPVADAETAAMLRQRKAVSGDENPLFPVNETDLLNHVHSFDGGGFITKDFRTLLGTRTAMKEVEAMPVPKTPAEYKKAVMNVAKVVSSKLGNTPSIALDAYINPTVFSKWQIAK